MTPSTERRPASGSASDEAQTWVVVGVGVGVGVGGFGAEVVSAQAGAEVVEEGDVPGWVGLGVVVVAVGVAVVGRAFEPAV